MSPLWATSTVNNWEVPCEACPGSRASSCMPNVPPSPFAQVEFALETHGCSGPPELALQTCPSEHEKVCTKHKGTGPLCLQGLPGGQVRCQKPKAWGEMGGHVIDSWTPGHQKVLPSPSLIWHCVTGPCRACVPMVSLHTGPLCAAHSVPLCAPLKGLGARSSCPFLQIHYSFRHLTVMLHCHQ